ncbi:unnamed protein product [Pleuronectes platessa]|uniref:Uncharacterized protein n=1 Tax=Pleuronectes platessa TaxID=8262 RepID=A0A9N7Y609_PLEPL|nr:unnamed protein product [Pleuronectes platessa]
MNLSHSLSSLVVFDADRQPVAGGGLYGDLDGWLAGPAGWLPACNPRAEEPGNSKLKRVYKRCAVKRHLWTSGGHMEWITHVNICPRSAPRSVHQAVEAVTFTCSTGTSGSALTDPRDQR